jgi:hypothetical protein
MMFLSSSTTAFLLVSCFLSPNLLVVVEAASLAERFAIEGPELEWQKDQAKFQLEYTVHNFITPEFVDYQIYNYDCKQVAEGDQQPLKLTLVVNDNTDDDENNAESTTTTTTSTKTTMSLSVELNPDEYQTSPLYQKSFLYKAHLKACIRFMLFSLPKDNPHSMEVNFEQTQVDLTLSKDGTTIFALEQSTLDKVGISVRVMGGSGGSGGGGGVQQAAVEEDADDSNKIVKPTPPNEEEL